MRFIPNRNSLLRAFKGLTLYLLLPLPPFYRHTYYLPTFRLLFCCSFRSLLGPGFADGGIWPRARARALRNRLDVEWLICNASKDFNPAPKFAPRLHTIRIRSDRSRSSGISRSTTRGRSGVGRPRLLLPFSRVEPDKDH